MSETPRQLSYGFLVGIAIGAITGLLVMSYNFRSVNHSLRVQIHDLERKVQQLEADGKKSK